MVYMVMLTLIGLLMLKPLIIFLMVKQTLKKHLIISEIQKTKFTELMEDYINECSDKSKTEEGML